MSSIDPRTATELEPMGPPGCLFACAQTVGKLVVEAEAVKRCVSCGAEPPVLYENTNLLSKRGWRLTRTTEEDGRVTLEWRCPRCWTRHRQMKAVKADR